MKKGTPAWYVYYTSNRRAVLYAPLKGFFCFTYNFLTFLLRWCLLLAQLLHKRVNLRALLL